MYTKQLAQTTILSVIQEMLVSIKKHDRTEQNRILKEHPWTGKWLRKRSHLLDLEEISSGDKFEVNVERPASKLREGYDLKPLLHIKISSTNGSRILRFEPVAGKDPEVFRLM